MRALRRASLLTAAILAVWFGALVWFVAAGLHEPVDRHRRTDAVVVLTGGRQRVETGLQLLAAGRAKKVFISGVNQHVDRDELLRPFNIPPERLACCVVLGHAADNTLGNAQETADWMRHEGYRSLRLVTSWYHIERGLLEFRRAMPETEIVPHPVFVHADAEHWWGWHGAAMVVFREYHKYLAALGRPLLDLVLPAEDPSGSSRDTAQAAGR